jgi:hypothetical protein
MQLTSTATWSPLLSCMPTAACLAALAVEAAAHELRRPSFRHIAGEGHAAGLAINRENGADDVVIRPFRIADQQWKEQGGARQTLGVVFAEITHIELERRLAVQFEQDIAAGAGDAAARPELVPAAGAAMADAHGVAVEADGAHRPAARRAVGADKRFAELRAVAGQPAGQRNLRAHNVGDACDQLAAVHMQAVRQHENSGQVLCRERPAYGFPAPARLLGSGNGLAGHPQRRRIKAQRRGSNVAVGDVVVPDLAAGAAAKQMRIRKHLAQFLIAVAAGERLPAAEIENEIGPVRGLAHTPGLTFIPRQTRSPHASPP